MTVLTLHSVTVARQGADMNYIENIKCEYYLVDNFNNKIKDVDHSRLSLFKKILKAYPNI